MTAIGAEASSGPSGELGSIPDPVAAAGYWLHAPEHAKENQFCCSMANPGYSESALMGVMRLSLKLVWRDR